MTSPIKNVFLNINNVCPFRCDYCWVRKTKGEQLEEQRQRMSLETLRATYDFFLKQQRKISEYYWNNIMVIIFATKEPLLDFNRLIKPFIEELNYSNIKERIMFQILTNGLLLTPEIAAFCKKYKIKILMSLDGNEESNNKNRKYFEKGKNVAFQKTIEGANFLSPEDRCFTFTINKNTIGNLRDSLEFLGEYPHNWTRFNFNLYSSFTEEDWFNIWKIFDDFIQEVPCEKSRFLYLYRHPNPSIDEGRGIIMGVDYLGNISIKKPFHSSIPWTEKNNEQYKNQGLIKTCGTVYEPIWENFERWIIIHGPNYAKTNFLSNPDKCGECFCKESCHPNTQYFNKTQYYELLPDECKIRQTDFKITESLRRKYGDC